MDSEITAGMDDTVADDTSAVVGEASVVTDSGDVVADEPRAVEVATSVDEISTPAQQPPLVGVFDSGIGGFTVAAAIRERRPDLDIVYFGDTLNMPYGGRSLSQLSRFARNNIEFLLDEGIDVLAVGCNASNSALGQGELKSFGVPVYDLVSSTVEWLHGLDAPPERIALVATEAAVRSGYWERKLKEALPDTRITARAAPRFVPLVEAHVQDEAANRAAVRQIIGPLFADGVLQIIHGCTHYPLLESYMAELCDELTFIDPAQCLADRLVANIAPGAAAAPAGKLRLFSSHPGEAFYRTAERVFGQDVRAVTKMYIVNPYED